MACSKNSMSLPKRDPYVCLVCHERYPTWRDLAIHKYVHAKYSQPKKPIFNLISKPRNDYPLYEEFVYVCGTMRSQVLHKEIGCSLTPEQDENGDSEKWLQDEYNGEYSSTSQLNEIFKTTSELNKEFCTTRPNRYITIHRNDKKSSTDLIKKSLDEQIVTTRSIEDKTELQVKYKEEFCTSSERKNGSKEIDPKFDKHISSHRNDKKSSTDHKKSLDKQIVTTKSIDDKTELQVEYNRAFCTSSDRKNGHISASRKDQISFSGLNQKKRSHEESATPNDTKANKKLKLITVKHLGRQLFQICSPKGYVKNTTLDKLDGRIFDCSKAQWSFSEIPKNKYAVEGSITEPRNTILDITKDFEIKRLLL